MDCSLSTTHKAAVIVNHGPSPVFEIQSLPLPAPGPTDLLVKLSTTGICGTDIALAEGKLGPTKPILGHEGIGRIVALGSALQHLDNTSVKVGQRVGVSWIRDTCGKCPMCLTDGGETRCETQTFSGMKVDGTFAEYTIVPARSVIPLPEGIPDEQLAPIMCAGVTAYKALKICGAVPGQWVAVSGAGGGVGALGIQYAAAMGYRVLAIDMGKEKREYCLGLKAEAFIDISEEKDVATATKSITGGLGAAAVLVTAGSGRAYQDAFGMLAPFGTLVCVGIPPPDQLVQFHPLTFIDNGFRVIGSSVGSRGDIKEAVEFVRRGVVIPAVQETTLDQIAETAKSLTDNKTTTKYIIRLSSAAEGGKKA
ncbi:alcohol dehydrogenase [Paecilomyces variotii No. 5]|uniref:Alcohol dehydrogenase n=1 Tax=Byssochlamys spectabilis (strain No. 5 / NBRC 109023) TaxID=1356009 RepID=V5G7M9_BYSSN|nr:alcohol dehydrogenase [Paecilomyces variotii No. 5]